MTPYLVDVNVWIALLVRRHQHHPLSLRWFDQLGRAEAGLCRISQLALTRLLANRTVMGESVMAPGAAWDLLRTLAEDERVEFIAEPAELDSILPTLLKYPIPTGKLVTDAYLAAFAMGASRTMVTLDRGFRQFRGLHVQILGA